MESMGTVGSVDWRLVPAGILILFALWVLAALALAVFDPAGHHSPLAICSAVFLLGLMSDYFFGRRAEMGSWWASGFTPSSRTGSFWLADALDMGKSTFQWGYVGKAFVYVVGYAGASLAVATALFENGKLS